MSRDKIRIGFFLAGPGRSMFDWRHPDMPPRPGTNFAMFKAQTLIAERAKVDLVFAADLLTYEPPMPYKMEIMEAVTLVSALASLTSNIGLAATISTSFSEPFNAARQFLALDHISGGRAAWNVVTTAQPNASGNFGKALPSHSDRYERASEYLDVVEGLWDSFEDDALVGDKASGLFIDTSKVHRLDHKGKYFQVDGPINMHRSPQGRPVLFTATTSDDGIEFASRRVDAVFTDHTNLEQAQEFYVKLKRSVAAHGRDPDSVTVMPAARLFVGRTDEEAQLLYESRNKWIGFDGAIKAVGQYIKHFDFHNCDLDQPFPLEVFDRNMEGYRGYVLKMEGSKNLWL